MANRDELDDLDRIVVSMLTEDGRLSASEIAGRIGNVSERTIRNRIAGLLQNRHIVIGAIPDPTASSRDVQADLWIDVEPGKVDEVAAQLGEYDEVGYLAAVTGQYTLTAAIFFNTNAELFEFTENVIGKIPGVRKVVTHMILRMYKIYGTRTTALSQSTTANGVARRARRTK
ncbi:Lrp/AsnC family transcriptional regulator for asnA, asnC and gidA [Pararhizobium capsulatum DSM 1112]|uniref:Lrp/AsnC family transcriptional regulator for asnA, asnC and gidA n=1 Tax=Pararhizobium capsulatum DSM 1112 TaxID=1121113 RepID=A0ABU0BWI1_9HYPH|nr:Lrp/AsnC family transcriptional regulator [Pararhizobium capsulatum]MDQ0322026.1 Lrp/AsnC family transcriptional regulator for asnA, asnC and gidA [Pararhizobium capsulatum DSM 1112]